MRKYKYTRTRFGKNGKRFITHTTRFNLSSYLKKRKETKIKKYLDNWYDTHDVFGKPRGYKMSDIMKFR